MRTIAFDSLMIFGICATTAVAVGGCASAAHYDPVIRRQQLLAMYPPGVTTRADVRRKWASDTPEFTATRPAAGWATVEKPGIGDRVRASEQRTGKPVERVDRFFAPDGLFALCYCWSYYDGDDKVVDAEWQFHSD
jgi:hypothetical protein